MNERADLSSADDVLRKMAGRHTAIGAFAAIVPFFANVITWYVYKSHLADLACFVRNDPTLLMLWPLNPIYAEDFKAGRFSESELCWFFASLSTASGVWLCFIVWRCFFELFRRDVRYVTGTLRPVLANLGLQSVALLTSSLFCVWALSQGFSAGDSFYGLSLSQRIETAAFKMIFVFMPGFYFVISYLIEITGLFLRYSLLSAVAFVRRL